MADQNKQLTEQSFYKARKGFLIGFHLPLQRIMVRYIGPLSVILYVFSAVTDRCWQNNVTLGGMIAMWITWAIAEQVTKRKADVETSVFIFAMSVILFETLETMIIEGTIATAVMGNISVVIYASLISRRYLYISAATALASFFLAEVVRFFQFYPIKVLAPDERLAVQLIFSVLLMGLATLILRRSQTINESLYADMSRAADAKSEVIAAAGQIQPVVEDVTRGIREISSNFATQASQQAAATAEVNATVQLVKSIAETTAASASQTRDTAEETRTASGQTTRNLQSVQSGFNEVVQIIETSRGKTAEFASWAESIEGILIANREISNQIKILAINAGVQAAKAGKFGTGFRVVAGELRSLIQDIDKNLESSTTLLEKIRQEAGENSRTIQRGADLLRTHFDRLRETGSSIEIIDDAFARTVESVEGIADEARKQSHSITEVTVSMSQIDSAASQMRDSSSILLESVERIAESHDSLKNLLSSR